MGDPLTSSPLFDLIAERAVKLCNAEVGVVSRLEGAVVERAALYGMVPEGAEVVRWQLPLQLTDETITTRVIRGRAAGTAALSELGGGHDGLLVAGQRPSDEGRHATLSGHTRS